MSSLSIAPFPPPLQQPAPSVRSSNRAVSNLAVRNALNATVTSAAAFRFPAPSCETRQRSQSREAFKSSSHLHKRLSCKTAGSEVEKRETNEPTTNTTRIPNIQGTPRKLLQSSKRSSQNHTIGSQRHPHEHETIAKAIWRKNHKASELWKVFFWRSNNLEPNRLVAGITIAHF